MSYEPTLIISKIDLHKNADKIEEECRKPPAKRAPEKQQRRHSAFRRLEELLAMEGFKLKGVDMVLTQPELTSLNRHVRELLHELSIEFAVHH